MTTKVNAIEAKNESPAEVVLSISVDGVSFQLLPPSQPGTIVIYYLDKIQDLSPGSIFTIQGIQFTFDPKAETAAVFLITGNAVAPVIAYEGTRPIN